MSSEHLVGQELGGTYRLVRVVGEGGMGTVYEATHLRLTKKRFAVKVLLTGAGDPAQYARFKREADVVAALGHPNIVDVLDFNVTPSGQPYMVMELLEGLDLMHWLTRAGRLPPGEVAQILTQVGDALQTTHDLGIIHRDLKPENIFLVEGQGPVPQVKLLDFGLSKIKDSQSKLTSEYAIFGTPFYMSPEQAEGLTTEVDHTTDIFALAVIVYQCLCGVVPFDGPTVPGILYNVRHSEPRAASELVPDLPLAVDEVLVRAMAKRKTARYQTVKHFVSDFLQALEGQRPSEDAGGPDRPEAVRATAAVTRPMAVVSPEALAATLPAPMEPAAPAPSPPASAAGKALAARRWAFWLFAVTMLGLGVTVAWFVQQGGPLLEEQRPAVVPLPDPDARGGDAGLDQTADRTPARSDAPAVFDLRPADSWYHRPQRAAPARARPKRRQRWWPPARARAGRDAAPAAIDAGPVRYEKL